MKKDLKEEFVRLTLRYIEGIENGPMSKSHAAHKRIQMLCKSICESEDKGNAFFSELITHAEPAVRLAAATFLYLSDQARAIAEFQALKKAEQSSISMAAVGNLWWIERGEFQITFD
ncbi:MAG: hypothetical protein H3C47_06875 [Candidatus Cloacimonetes bacterium]|nr:hypothetical protein [Candidatus Cloacimonadota bacterium]